MTIPTYTLPTIGQPNSTEDPKVRNALSEISTILTGNVDSSNLADNAVGTSELQNGSVTATKLASSTGAPLVVVTNSLIGAPGQASVLAPGRELTASDFTGLGLSAPIGLYNLSNINDSSGNARNLTNKGTVTFASGIQGIGTTAAQFTGSTAQALYIADTGANDPFRLKTGSFGCWFRTAKRGTDQNALGKWTNVGNQRGWYIGVLGSLNVATLGYSNDGVGAAALNGISDVADDRWHCVIVTADGGLWRLYVDGVLEAAVTFGSLGMIFGSSAPFNIGAVSADGATAASGPHYGRVDEAFVLSDVLTDDQVRFLYCSKLTHGYPSTPKQSWVQVKRQRRGAALVTGDFPSTPLRLHNFTAGALTDAGSNNQTLTNNGTALAVSGADGSTGNAFNFVTASSQNLSATDTGLPSGTNARSYGCWFKSTNVTGTTHIVSWGQTKATSDVRLIMQTGTLLASSAGDNITGVYVADGQWHYATVVEDNSSIDGVKRKLYLDGRLIGGSTVLNAITLGGANKFRIGSSVTPDEYFTGQIDGVFVIDAALTPEQIAVLYQKSSQQLTSSPKNEGDHVEGHDATYLYLDMSTLPSNSLVDIQVQG